AVHRGAHVLGDLALQKMRRTDGKLHDSQPAGHLAKRVVMGLPVFRRDCLGELVAALPEDHLEAIEDAGPAQRRGLGPCGPSGLRRSYGATDLLGRGERNGLLGLASGGVVDGLAAAGRAGDARAVDIVGDLGHGFPPERRWRLYRSLLSAYKSPEEVIRYAESIKLGLGRRPALSRRCT